MILFHDLVKYLNKIKIIITIIEIRSDLHETSCEDQQLTHKYYS